MPIQQEPLISVSPVLKMILDSNDESITINYLDSVNTFAEVVEQVIKPGLESIPGKTTFSVKDFEFFVSLDESLADNVFVFNGLNVAIATNVLDALVARYPLPVLTEEVDGVTQFVVYLSTNHNPGLTGDQYNEELKNALLSKVGTTLTDDITPEEAFTAILEVAGVV